VLVTSDNSHSRKHTVAWFLTTAQRRYWMYI